MTSALIPLANGCEELEAVTVIDLLRRAGVTVTTAGLTAGPVTASRGVVLVPDTTLDQALESEYKMLILPGGLPGADHLAADSRVADLLRSMHQRGAFLGAICAAPKVLSQNGVLTGKNATAYPGVLEAEAHPKITAQAVTRDGNVITSRGPGTALDFALELIEVLQGSQIRQEVEAGLQR